MNKDEELNYVIEMNILDKSDFISPYCSKTPVISSEAALYLDNALKYVSPKREIEINIVSNVIEENEKEFFKNAIINYYSNNIKQHFRDLFHYNILSFVLLLIGVIFIVIMLIVETNSSNQIWSTILEIVGWVFIWEAAYTFFFEKHKTKIELLKSKQIVNAKITINN